MKFPVAGIAFLFAALAGGVSASAAEYPVAGAEPSLRPAGAPVITRAQHDKAWVEKFYQGVSKPYPPHLAEQDLGAWYSPFTHAGMVGRYDIRDWHQPVKPRKK